MSKTYKGFLFFFYVSLGIQILRLIFVLLYLGFSHVIVTLSPSVFFYYLIIEDGINHFYINIYPYVLLVLSVLALIGGFYSRKKYSTLIVSQEMRLVMPIIVWVSLFKMVNFFLFTSNLMNYDILLQNLTYQFSSIYIVTIKFFVASITSGILALYTISLIRVSIKSRI